jgi:hypothetical protein
MEVLLRRRQRFGSLSLSLSLTDALSLSLFELSLSLSDGDSETHRRRLTGFGNEGGLGRRFCSETLAVLALVRTMVWVRWNSA